MKPKQNSKVKTAIFSAILLMISVLSGIFLLLIYTSSTKTLMVPVSVNPVKAGSIITADDITLIEISNHNIPSTVIKDSDQIVSRYATRDIGEGELFFRAAITDDYAKRLSEKAKYGAISIPISGIDTVTGDIKENDFVRILISMKKNKEEDDYGESSDQLPSTNTALIYTKELSAVRVLGLYNSEGAVVNRETGDTSSANQLVLDPLPVQRILLNQARDNGKIRVVILPEFEQQAYRKQWGLADEIIRGKIQNDLYDGLKSGEQIEKNHMTLSDQENLEKFLKRTDRVEGEKSESQTVAPGEGNQSSEGEDNAEGQQDSPEEQDQEDLEEDPKDSEGEQSNPTEENQE